MYGYSKHDLLSSFNNTVNNNVCQRISWDKIMKIILYFTSGKQIAVRQTTEEFVELRKLWKESLCSNDNPIRYLRWENTFFNLRCVESMEEGE